MSSKQIEMQASDWLARLDSGDTTPQLCEAVAAWRAADPRHEVAFLRIKAGWGRLDRLQALRPALTAGIDQDLLRSAAAGEPRSGRSARVFSRLFPAAAAVVLVIAAAWAVARFVRDPVYTTGVGGFERVQLADGSVIELNTDTEVRTSFDKSLRTVELLKGEAHFTVARDATRPFVVMAGDTAVRAVGTAFNVRRHKGSAVEVIVTEGKVAVGPSAVMAIPGPLRTPSPAAPLVSAGQAASVAQGHLQVRDLPSAETARELAWQSGMLLFEADALADVVNEFNRYNRRQLEVADAALAPLKIGGYFKAANIDAFVSVLQKDFGVQATVERDRIVLRSAVK